MNVLLTGINNYLGKGNALPQERPFMPVPPVEVSVWNVHSHRPVALCENPDLMPDTVFESK